MHPRPKRPPNIPLLPLLVAGLLVVAGEAIRPAPAVAGTWSVGMPMPRRTGDPDTPETYPPYKSTTGSVVVTPAPPSTDTPGPSTRTPWWLRLGAWLAARTGLREA